MRAVVLTGFGGSEKLEYRTDVADPQAGQGEVLIRVGATSINNTDIWTRKGSYGADSTVSWRGETLAFPRIQGADVVGWIEQTGKGVPTARIGERVIIDPMTYPGDERDLASTVYLGSERDGGFAEFVTVPAANAHPTDSPLPDAELATFPTAYGTAMRMLERAAVTSGDVLAVTGASGGVGSALIQLGTARGARVIAITSPRYRQQAKDLGAYAAVDRDSPNLLGEVHAATGSGVDVVADVVAGARFPELLRMLKRLGRYVVAGAKAGPLVETDLRTVYLNELQLIGSSFWTHQDFARLLEHIDAGELTPLLAATYPLSELHRAQQDFTAKDFFGKLVVVPEQG